MTRTFVVAAVLWTCSVASAGGEDISGEIKNPNQQFGAGVHFRLIGATDESLPTKLPSQPFLAYLQNENAELRVDGSLTFLETGVLTYDGVHPNATGNLLLANHLAQGIFEATRLHWRK
jgi:lysophospholipase L1-like esterase